ncbi:MAG: WecB/TagA/CpsF family glycosyltransferase [Candidatus Thiodiazotropha sp. (ex Lucinoma borealis)]|nr:WecB/TagA/CpsF family glycosyltransferase [Candidatus Thiodiazotropha sp. (ex Lucinoma borealis)]
MSNRIKLMGCYIDNLTMEETLCQIERLIRSGECHQHVVVNVDKIVKANKDNKIKEIINTCSLINVDGMPVVWASKVLGVPLKQRVAGIDLFEELMRWSAEEKLNVYLLGAKEEIVLSTKRKYEAIYNHKNIVGYRNGYWSDEDELSVVNHIRDAAPDLLFVAISSPKKEEFLGKYQKIMEVPFAMGVGGTFDVVAGKVRRAPIWMQQSGLEWFYRFLQEPRRMFRRYFIDDMKFISLLFNELVKRNKS